MDSQRLELDLHRLELRFASSRLLEPRAVARIAHSIERCGQIVPCIVVAVPGDEGGGAAALVLIDGYRRIAALRRLGRDTASVERWTCDVTDALLGLLTRTQNRPFASIEEALLLRELVQGQGLSQHDVARRCGRDVSWVSRRLQLLSGLPDAALAAVRGGKLSVIGNATSIQADFDNVRVTAVSVPVTPPPTPVTVTNFSFEQNVAGGAGQLSGNVPTGWTSLRPHLWRPCKRFCRPRRQRRQIRRFPCRPRLRATSIVSSTCSIRVSRVASIRM